MPDKSPRNSTAPAHPLADGADARHIAEATAATWRAVDAALSPVIGQLGVAALHRRSLHLIRAEHPFVGAVIEGALAPAADFSALRDALSQQSAADAAAASLALQRTFQELLSSLIGPSLTERLLRSVWHPLTSGSAVQDTPR